MRKVCIGPMQFTPYRPWSSERRAAARAAHARRLAIWMLSEAKPYIDEPKKELVFGPMPIVAGLLTYLPRKFSAHEHLILHTLKDGEGRIAAKMGIKPSWLVLMQLGREGYLATPNFVKRQFAWRITDAGLLAYMALEQKHRSR